jgi:2-methylisocitrate lyase-like PEP mutase family enzyme
VSASADCVYPITLNDLGLLKRLREAIGAPINVYASPGTPPVGELEAARIARLSMGPGLLRASLAVMRRIAVEVRSSGSCEALTSGSISSEEIEGYLRETWHSGAR